MITQTQSALIGACARAGVPLPPNVDEFGYADAPLFHSLALGTFGLELDDDQCDKVVAFAQDYAKKEGREDCSPSVNWFALSLLEK